ncbi:UNVERIFIED_CONTAM: AcrR family transcriptional regulator [Brevibacillus sp. OAP136]
MSKKDLITEGALRAFAQNGYAETTMDAIADVAKVAKGTLYYHFKTKEELFYYVNRKGVDLLVQTVTHAMKDEGRSVAERMLAVFDEHLRFFADNKDLCILLLQFSSGDQERDSMIGSLLGEYFATMEKFLRALQEQGIINAELDVHTLASALFGMVGFTALRQMYRGEAIYTDETRNTLIALCKGALGLQS